MVASLEERVSTLVSERKELEERARLAGIERLQREREEAARALLEAYERDFGEAERETLGAGVVFRDEAGSVCHLEFLYRGGVVALRHTSGICNPWKVDARLPGYWPSMTLDDQGLFSSLLTFLAINDGSFSQVPEPKSIKVTA